MSDQPLTTCEVCGGKVKRLIGKGAGIIFKGSGFYCTDYKKPTTNSGGSSGQSQNEPTAEKAKPAGETKAGEAGKPAGEVKASETGKPTTNAA